MKINVSKLILSLSLPLFIGLLGFLYTAPQLYPWYGQLNKPALLPPSGVFGPTWTLLYILMGAAFYLIWTADIKRNQPDADRPWAAKVYLAQLAFNLLWSMLFFEFHLLAWATLEILALWVLIFFTIREFKKIRAVTLWLLLPYLVWVTFASYLTAAVWWLN